MVQHMRHVNIQGEPDEDTNTCKECKRGVQVLDEARGEKVCNACGLVVKEKIMDLGQEWRAFDADQKKKRARAGAPLTYTIHDKGLSTVIDFRDRDALGRRLSPVAKAQVYRMRKWQQRFRTAGPMERNLAIALGELDRMASALSLPRTLRETTAKLYRNAVKNHLIRGRSIEGTVAASIYAGCRLCLIPRTLQEIAGVARVDKKEIGRCYRFISARLGLSAGPTSPVDYLSRFASDLQLSAKCQATARHVLEVAGARGLISGRGPTGLAAAALYLASVLEEERRTQREVAKAAQVTEVTVRNRFKELVARLHITIDMSS